MRAAVRASVLVCAAAMMSPIRTTVAEDFPTGTGDHLLQGMMGMMGQFARQFQDSQMGKSATGWGQQGNGMAWSPGMDAGMESTLDGAWRGRSGEYLLIEGQRFRIHADRQRYIDGRLQLRDGMVAFYYPQRKEALLYRYRTDGDRMLLQDQQGQILPYQRLSTH